MRIQPWLLVSLTGISILSLGSWLFAWWWSRWPERTALEFVEVLARDDYSEASDMATVPLEYFGAAMLKRTCIVPGEVVVKIDRNKESNLIEARCSFRVSTDNAAWDYGFTVERGKIIADYFLSTEELSKTKATRKKDSM